jgi:hypothetical protein
MTPFFPPSRLCSNVPFSGRPDLTTSFKAELSVCSNWPGYPVIVWYSLLWSQRSQMFHSTPRLSLTVILNDTECHLPDKKDKHRVGATVFLGFLGTTWQSWVQSPVLTSTVQDASLPHCCLDAFNVLTSPVSSLFPHSILVHSMYTLCFVCSLGKCSAFV